MFSLNGVQAMIMLLYLLVFAALIRAYVFDSAAVVYTFPFVLMVILTTLFFLKSVRMRFTLNKYVLLIYLMFLEMGIYLTNFVGETAFSNVFFYFAPVFYFVSVMVLFDRDAVNRHLVKFFKVVFIVESFVIMLEVVDEFLGFDIHSARLFAWYIEVDNRFEEHIFGPNANIPYLEILPIAMGIHGFPHYTAPLYVVSFIFVVAQIFTPMGPGSKAIKPINWTAILMLVVGLFCIYTLAVKTHYVTATLSIIIMGVFLSRRILWLFALFLAVAVPATLLVAAARARFEILLDQVLVGNPIEGSRIDVIFNFREYLVLLNLDLTDLLVGTGNFAGVNEFARTLFLEQKILVYTLVFGIPYILVIVGFFAAGMLDSIRVFRRSRDPATKATAISVGCGLLVYGLEMGHFGFTFNTPNFALVFVMIGMIAVLAKDKKRDGVVAVHV